MEDFATFAILASELPIPSAAASTQKSQKIMKT
jgi:hypothetical protein